MKHRGNAFAVVPVGLTLVLVSCAHQHSRSQVPRDGYPYLLSLGHSVYRVEQEAESERLRLSLVRWMDGSTGLDTVFRVTNPGDRAVLIWNVRQQSLVDEGGATNWSTLRDDFPGRGWDRPAIAAGGTLEFPIASPVNGSWRVGLLYSREVSGRGSTGNTGNTGNTNRLFDGTFEVMGPVVVETGGDALD